MHSPIYKSHLQILNIDRQYMHPTEEINPKISSAHCSDISDHLPCFAILEYPSKISRPKVRVFNKASIQTFVQDLQHVNWRPIHEDVNPSSSFKIFLDIFKLLYDKNFPLQT